MCCLKVNVEIFFTNNIGFDGAVVKAVLTRKASVARQCQSWCISLFISFPLALKVFVY